MNNQKQLNGWRAFSVIVTIIVVLMAMSKMATWWDVGPRVDARVQAAMEPQEHALGDIKARLDRIEERVNRIDSSVAAIAATIEKGDKK